MQYPVDIKISKLAEAYKAKTAREAERSTREGYYAMVRNFVLNYAQDEAQTPGAFAHDLYIVVNGFRFAILQRQNGTGIVQVQEVLNGIVWLQETIHGADICIREYEQDGGRTPAPWIAVILKYVTGQEQTPYRVTPIYSVNIEGKGVSVCA